MVEHLEWCLMFPAIFPDETCESTNKQRPAEDIIPLTKDGRECVARTWIWFC